jgi:phenylacetate-CoA ligase
MDGATPAAAGTDGDLVCTGLANPDMPLIRYRVGDRGRLPAAADACPCGRGLPVLSQVEGRIGDALYTRDGRRIGRLINVLNGTPIREAQIIQLSLDRLEIRYVTTPAAGERAGEELAEKVRERMGDVSIDLVPLAEIPRGPNGKLRMTVCRLSEEEKSLVGSC